MMRIFYLLGVPGSGKTTLMRHVFAPAGHVLMTEPFAHTMHYINGGTPVVELGKARRNGFGGTDALAMNATTRVEAWMDAMRDDVFYIAGEGDRLATDRFLSYCSDFGSLTVALLQVPPELAAERCRARGSTQSESWQRGRATKVERLAQKWVDEAWLLDGTQTPEQLARIVREHPTFAPLQGGH